MVQHLHIIVAMRPKCSHNSHDIHYASNLAMTTALDPYKNSSTLISTTDYTLLKKIIYSSTSLSIEASMVDQPSPYSSPLLSKQDYSLLLLSCHSSKKTSFDTIYGKLNAMLQRSHLACFNKIIEQKKPIVSLLSLNVTTLHSG